MPTAERVLRAWIQITQHSGGAPIAMAHICAAAVAGVGADGAAVTVMVSPTVRDAVHTTDRVAADLEEWQLAFGQGPCVDAFTDNGPVLVPDLEAPNYAARWPAFTPAALGSGARGVFVLPIHIGAIELGVLALYRRTAGALSTATALVVVFVLVVGSGFGVLAIAGGVASVTIAGCGRCPVGAL